MLTASSFNKSEEQANLILSNFKIKQAPTPVEEIAHKLNINVIEYNLGDSASGVLFINKEMATIGYNPQDPIARRRFTIAHELGHYIMHRDFNNLFVDKDFMIKKFRNSNSSYTAKEYRQEQEANAFAAALLMPKHLIEVEMVKEDIYDLNEMELITQLAKKFQVSIAAISFRLANLNIYF